MTKYVKLLLFSVLCASPLVAQRGTIAIPAQAQMDRYPLHSAVHMTAGEMAKYQLHPVALVEATEVLNYYRNINRFVLEVLPVGTVVLSDSLGVPRYKADCVNRLVLPALCPACLGLIANARADSVLASKLRADSVAHKGAPLGLGSTAQSGSGFWSRFEDTLRSIGDTIGDILSILLPLLLWLAIIGLMFAGLWWLINQIRNSGSAGGSPRVTPAPVPPVAPPTPVAGPVHPVPSPVSGTPVVSPVASTVGPTPPVSKPSRMFVHVSLADGQGQPNTVIRHSEDINSVTYESENGVNTLRFRQKA